MKKLLFSVAIVPNDDAITLADVETRLKELGATYFLFRSELELCGSGSLSGREVWLYVSADDSEPYVQVSGCGETDGVEMSDEAVAEMREKGVCVEFFAEYPRADRYGAPAYATHDDFAAGVVGDHLFRVAATDFSVRAEDRGDDGAEQIWLKIVLPE